jgi:formate hydrogenlyase transcriptional activator
LPSTLEQYRALLEVSESIALHRDLKALFHDLADRLHPVVEFSYLNVILHEPDRNAMRLYILETSEQTEIRPGFENPVSDTPAGRVWETQRPYVVGDLDQETQYPRIAGMLQRHGVRSICLVPLTTAHRRLGALGVGSTRPDAYREADIDMVCAVATQVALAVDNALNFERVEQYQQQLARERDRLHVLLEVNNALVSNLAPREVFRTISAMLRRVFQHDYASLALFDPESGEFRVQALDFPGRPEAVDADLEVELENSPAGYAFRTGAPLLLDSIDGRRFASPIVQELLKQGIRSAMCVPLATGKRRLGTLNVASLRERAFTREQLDLLGQIAAQVAIAVENALAYRQIEELKDKLAEEKLYLEDEIRTEYNFEEIVGESAVLKRALEEVRTVAPTPSTVLILGESGTGKELIARALHNLSPRRDRTLVKVNCAAIPTGLLESELFGHEKGGFTGAISQKIGRFELANHGTLFLDEIGDIPLELQPKLLRVLQEREFERLGGTRTIRVDVRLVTASNRDLSRMVADRQFREDLFYRINVFPIHLPALRERREDVPLLVRYFAQKYAQRMNKQIETIPSVAMDALCRWNWPGNVRELENLIERAVILSPGRVLHVPVAELQGATEGISTLAAAERQHIVRALRDSDWIVGGAKGAAARLGMKRTTLQSKMRKLGITRQGGLARP